MRSTVLLGARVVVRHLLIHRRDETAGPSRR